MKRERKSEFSISGFHVAWHIFGLVLAIGLPFSLIMADLTHGLDPHIHHKHHGSQMLIPYLLLTLILAIMAITTLLTVRKVKFSPEGIEISTLLWRQRLTQKSIKAFRSVPNLSFAWLKTPYIVYLLPKQEFGDWQALEQALNDYLLPH